MASRGGSHADVVTERRLKPIYDNLDNGNYKTAMTLADKVLKKHRDTHCAKVLKALALLRMGKSDESLTLAQEVVALKPCDEPTLQALSICFREMHKPEYIVDVYTEAVKGCPSHEEFHTHLFMALVRMDDYKRQQQVAMGLYKLYPKNPYYFWGVMSIIMQGLTATEKSLARAMYFPLAEKMIEKMVKDDRLEAEAEVSIYLMVLDYLDKHEKALDVIQGDLQKYIQADVTAKKAELLDKLERWPEMNSAYKELISGSPDNWYYYQKYFKSAYALIDKGWNPPEDESEKEKLGNPDYTVEIVMEFVHTKVEEEKQKMEQNSEQKSHKKRAPYLAQLELLKIMTGRSSPEAQRIGKATELLSNYFAMYGHKPVCFRDLQQYLDLVPSDDRSAFIQRLLDTVQLEKKDNNEIAYPLDANQMQKHLCILQMTRTMGLHGNLSKDELLALVAELVERHQHGLLFGENLLRTDLQHSDNYLLLAVHILLDLWQENGDDHHLFTSIMLLEEGLKSSVSSHQFKLMLIRLYCIIGAFGPVPVLYDSTEIKHIQQETVGYLAARYVVSTGHLSKANSLFHIFLKFYTGNHKDTTEYIITAYKYGSFHKIPEFLKFRDRISHSLHFAQTTVEKMLLELYQEAENGTHTLLDLIKEMEIVPENDELVFLDETDWNNLHDNRDLDVLVSWVPKERQLSSPQRDDTKIQEMTWLRMRTLFLRALAAAVYLIPSHQASASATSTNDTASKNGEAPDRGVTLHKLIGEWEALVTKAKEDPAIHRKFPIQGPPESRASDYIKNQHSTVIAQLLTIVLDIHHLQIGIEDQTKGKEQQEAISKNLTQVPELLTEMLRKSRRSVIYEKDDRRKFDSCVLSELVAIAETMTFAILLSGIMCKLLKPIKVAANKRSKKKKGAPGAAKPMPPVFENFRNYLDSLIQIADGLVGALEDVNTTFVTEQFSQFNLCGADDSQKKLFKTQDEVEKDMWKKLEESYEESTKEVSDVFKKRIAYLKTLRL